MSRTNGEAGRAVSLRDLAHVKPLEGHKGCYRLRVGAYRIGFYADGDTLEFVRFLDRKDIYRYFP